MVRTHFEADKTCPLLFSKSADLHQRFVALIFRPKQTHCRIVTRSAVPLHEHGPDRQDFIISCLLPGWRRVPGLKNHSQRVFWSVADWSVAWCLKNEAEVLECSGFEMHKACWESRSCWARGAVGLGLMAMPWASGVRPEGALETCIA